MNLTFQYISKALQEQFYVNVPFVLQPSKITDAVEAFFKFLDEPESVKTHIDFAIIDMFIFQRGRNFNFI